MDQIFQQIATLVQRGEFQKAKQLADKISSNVDRYNVLGIIFYQEGKLDEAIDNFKKALETDPTHDDTLFNYAKVLFEKNEHFESWRYLTRIKQKIWEVYDMLGDTQLKQNNPAMAIHYYEKAAELSDQQQMKEKYQQAKNMYKKSEKLAIFCLPGLDNFIKDIADILSNIYDVKLVVTTDGKQIVEAYNWADIVWLEWANEMAMEITNNLPKAGKRILCRLHSYEALANYPEKINWQNIDTLVLVAEHMRSILENYHQQFYRNIKDKTIIIPNGVDLNRFSFKIRSPGHNVAIVAHINHKKDPAMWLQVIGMLKKIDERYTLHIAGDFQEIRYANYFKHFIKDTGLEKNVQLYGFVKDIEAFLENKNYLLSTSIHEGHPYNIMEAMARGIKPIIHNYAGAKQQWPEDLVYNFVYEIQSMLSDEYNSERYRRFAEMNYSLENQIKRLFSLLDIQPNHQPRSFQINKPRKINIIITTSGKPDIRKGGPLGYIANMFRGLSQLENSKFELQYLDINELMNKPKTFFNTIRAIHFHSTFDLYNFLSRGGRNQAKDVDIILTSHSPGPWYKEAFEERYFENLQLGDGNVVNIDKEPDRFLELLSKIDKNAFENSDYLFFASYPSLEGYFGHDSQLDYVLNKKLQSKSIFYFWSGVEPLLPKMKKGDLRKKLGLTQQDFIISYVGRHNRVKGYDLLQELALKLWKQGKNVIFLVAGREYPLKGLQDQRWVEIGWTDDPGSIIQDSDLFVVPNRRCYFDLGILEALSLGKIVVTSAIGGSSEIIRVTRGVIGFRVNDLNDLTEKVESVINSDRSTLETLEKENLIIYEKYFTAREMMKRYLNTLNEIYT